VMLSEEQNARQARKKPSKQSLKRLLRFLLETGRLDEQTIDALSTMLEQCALDTASSRHHRVGGANLPATGH
jgi:hypothetical protein